MTGSEIALGALIGFAAGLLSGLFGVGGGSVMTPAIAVMLAVPPLQAIATPLPVIIPTAAVGANNYRRAGRVDWRAVRLAVAPGLLGAIFGAFAADWIDSRGASHGLLLLTAAIVGWESFRIIKGRDDAETPDRSGEHPGWQFAVTGLAAGLVSGLLGVGGGIVMVPVFTALLGMPLKKALGTSLCVMIPMVIPGTIIHSALGNIDWAVAGALALGVVPGAWIGSKLALAARDRTLHIAVGSFLMAVAVAYGALELAHVAGWTK